MLELSASSFKCFPSLPHPHPPDPRSTGNNNNRLTSSINPADAHIKPCKGAGGAGFGNPTRLVRLQHWIGPDSSDPALQPSIHHQVLPDSIGSTGSEPAPFESIAIRVQQPHTAGNKCQTGVDKAGRMGLVRH